MSFDNGNPIIKPELTTKRLVLAIWFLRKYSYSSNFQSRLQHKIFKKLFAKALHLLPNCGTMTNDIFQEYVMHEAWEKSIYKTECRLIH
jgi:hypothetical protein